MTDNLEELERVTPGTPPQDGSTFYGLSWGPYRWKAYKPSSEQARRGTTGRYQAMNEYGGWENASPPSDWWPEQGPSYSSLIATAREVEGLRAALRQCADLVRRYNGRQSEKLDDIPGIVAAALGEAK